MQSVKTVFNENCKHLVFNKALADRISKYKIKFEYKNEDHQTFFGGNTTGVQKVRFLPEDTDVWFNDILQVDELTLAEQVLDLPAINKEFHVSSDVFNLSCVWMAHKFLTSPYLSDQQKEQVVTDCLLVLLYKLLTSLLYRYFKYPADIEVAKATYARLNGKFILKQKGNWRDTLILRAQSTFIEKTSEIEDGFTRKPLHLTTLTNFNSDYEVVNMLNDIQGRIRSMLKNIYRVFMDVHKSGIKIHNTSSLSIDQEGLEVLKDMTKGLLTYTHYLNSIVADKNSFFKQELFKVICDMMQTMTPAHLENSIYWCSDNYMHSTKKEVEDLIKTTLTHSFSFLRDNRSIVSVNNDLMDLLNKLKNIYTSSRTIEPELLLMRDLGEKIVVHSNRTKNKAAIAAARTGLLLYICLRAYTMHHFTHK